MDLQVILNKWGIKMDVNIILSMWNESHRHYHSLDHLTSLTSDIDKIYKNKVSEKEYEKLIITSLFHDIVYDPTKSDNEEKSSSFFLDSCQDKSNKDIIEISQAILDTKTHESKSELSKKFNQLDMSIVEKNYEDLLNWENGIYQEYKMFGKDVYKKNRITFLESLLDKYNHNAGNLLKLIDYVKSSY